jgi:FkbM family methyltransferase
MQKLPRRLELLDVGARDGLQWPWDRVRECVSASFVEPDPEEAARLREKYEAVIEAALWREPASLTLNITKSPGASSVFRPNRKVLDQFAFPERFEIAHTVRVEATTIDALPDREIDFLKIDTQGAELAILEGGVNRLQRLVGLEVEVEFCEMYEGQPHFSEVDRFVREKLGLELWDIRRSHWKYRDGLDSSNVKGRLIFGDALYLRPLTTLPRWLEQMGADGPDKLAMLALAAITYGFDDYAQALLKTSQFAPEAKAALDAMTRRPAIRPLKVGSWRIFILLDALAKAFKPLHNGWSSGGEDLGSRRRWRFWC